jgi:hypothetical protein
MVFQFLHKLQTQTVYSFVDQQSFLCLHLLWRNWFNQGEGLEADSIKDSVIEKHTEPPESDPFSTAGYKDDWLALLFENLAMVH